jgi:hypothetical protein
MPCHPQRRSPSLAVVLITIMIPAPTFADNGNSATNTIGQDSYTSVWFSFLSYINRWY